MLLPLEAVKMAFVNHAIIVSAEMVISMMWTRPVAYQIVAIVAAMAFALHLGCVNVSKDMNIES